LAKAEKAVAISSGVKDAAPRAIAGPSGRYGGVIPRSRAILNTELLPAARKALAAGTLSELTSAVSTVTLPRYFLS